MKTENSCEFVDLLNIVVYILDEIKFSFTKFSFTNEYIRWYGKGDGRVGKADSNEVECQERRKVY